MAPQPAEADDQDLALPPELEAAIAEAVAVLAAGGVVALPTETVYGLAADAANPAAVERIFAVKGRPAGHPLIVHLAGVDQVAAWADLDPGQAAQVDALAAAFWPGPLTIVVPRSDRVAPQTVGGRSTVGLRVPDHPVALAVLRRFGGGLAAPSANRFGKVSPTTAAHVRHDLGDAVDVVLDGGPTRVGVESTIVELGPGGPTLLRPGGVSLEQLTAVLGVPVHDGRAGPSRASGMLRSHYAPAAAVELVAADRLASRIEELAAGAPATVGLIVPDGVVDLDEVSDQAADPEPDRPTWRLPARAEGFAAGLYDALRRADEAGVKRLLVVPPAEGELLDAVLDRLTKAAAPRPRDG
ncbi:MAG: L-threonylcarbamoyladenylate synthase [Actinomycetota bacterium]